MSTTEPLVSIGVPVYNGEKYLEEVLDSIVAQTYGNLEIIISDNASTDSTPQIARAYREKDGRVRYHRNRENIGASRNHNKAFELATGELFEWASADNVLRPQYVEKCVALLVADPTIVLAHSRCTVIDEFSGEESPHDVPYNLGASATSERLVELFTHIIGMNDPIFGVIRCEVLRQTQLLKSYIGADDGLLVELALQGPFGFVPEYLIRLRSHPDAYHAIKLRSRPEAQQEKTKKKVELTEDTNEAVWFDPVNKGKFVFPHWRRLREHATAVMQCGASPLEKLRMLGFLARVASWRRSLLVNEVRSLIHQRR